MNFKEKLREQLGFLRASCKSYDQGDQAEAIRLATTLRVIFNQTKISTSLLTHLGASNLMLLSTCTPSSNRDKAIPGLCRILLSTCPPEISGFPFLADSLVREYISFERWWKKELIVRVGETNFCRRSLILCAANKDGGAHVDAKLPNDYIEFSSFGEFSMNIIEPWPGCGLPAGGKVTCNNMHLASLRQIGYEVLNSPQLKRLCWLG